MTVISYLNQVRVEAAKKLLISTEMNMDEIAEQTGFESSKYFCRVFRNMTGQAPSLFRRAYKARTK